MIIGDFEPNLVVAFPGGAMGDRVSSFLGGDFHLCLGDQRPGDGGAEKIAALVNGIGPEHGEHEITSEFFLQIEDVAGTCPGLFGFFRNMIQFFTLTEVGGKGDHFTTVFLDQPLEDDRCIQPAGIGEYRFFDLSLFTHC